MLKLVVIAALLAAVTSSPIYPSYVASPYYNEPQVPFNPFGLFGYGYHAPMPYFRTGLPNPYIAPTPYAAPQQPVLPFASAPVGPVYLSPEQHHMYNAAVASLNPLEYAAILQADKEQKENNQQKQS